MATCISIFQIIHIFLWLDVKCWPPVFPYFKFIYFWLDVKRQPVFPVCGEISKLALLSITHIQPPASLRAGFFYLFLIYIYILPPSRWSFIIFFLYIYILPPSRWSCRRGRRSVAGPLADNLSVSGAALLSGRSRWKLRGPCRTPPRDWDGRCWSGGRRGDCTSMLLLAFQFCPKGWAILVGLSKDYPCSC